MKKQSFIKYILFPLNDLLMSVKEAENEEEKRSITETNRAVLFWNVYTVFILIAIIGSLFLGNWILAIVLLLIWLYFRWPLDSI